MAKDTDRAMACVAGDVGDVGCEAPAGRIEGAEPGRPAAPGCAEYYM
jgi:hypothetical protein